MLSRAMLKSPSQALSYYEKDDYYASDQTPSRWHGKLAKHHKLRGEVDKNDFRNVLHGVFPDGSETRKPKDAKKIRAGLDMTFSAPKSVSLKCYLGDEKGIKEAHKKAVLEALDYVERNYAYARKRIDGQVVSIKTDNLMYALFDYDVSRELDMQLHTHAVLANATLCDDGNTRAFFNDFLYKAGNKEFLGNIYRAKLSNELQKMGYEIEVTHEDGRLEIKGYNREHIDEFSKRRKQILEAVEKLRIKIEKIKEKQSLGRKLNKSEEKLSKMDIDDFDSIEPELRRIIVLDSRKKKVNFDRSKLREEWKERAQQIGLSVLRPKEKSLAQRRPDIYADEITKSAITHLEERQVAITKEEILKYALKRSIGQCRVDTLENSIRKQERHGRLVEVALDRYVTSKIFDYEAKTITSIKRGKGKFSEICDTIDVNNAILEANRNLEKQYGKDSKLSDGQAEAVLKILGTNDRVVAIQGYAGTGKTTSLEIVRELAERHGYLVEGVAPTSNAARVLEAESGIKSDTIKKLLMTKSADRPPPAAVGAGKPKLWVVDECSMIGAKTASELMSKAERENARVVLVGDYEQMPAIEVGLPFAQVFKNKKVDVVTIDEIQRQKDSPKLLEAVMQVIKGEKHERDENALEILQETVFDIKRRDSRLKSLANEYLKDPENSLIVTGRNEDRLTLNNQIRKSLIHDGKLGDNGLEGQILRNRSLTQEEKKSVQSYRQGDVVTFDRAYKKLGVKYGQTGKVESIDINQNEIKLDIDGKKVTWVPWKNKKVQVSELEDREIRGGDKLKFTKNDRELKRKNGEFIKIVSIDEKKKTAQFLRLDKKGRVISDKKPETLDLKSYRHWEHGYVSTIYSSQGMTVDKVLINIDTKRDRRVLGHEAWYVTLSCARKDAFIYTDDSSKIPESIKRDMIEKSGLEQAPEDRRLEALQKAAEEKRFKREFSLAEMVKFLARMGRGRTRD